MIQLHEIVGYLPYELKVLRTFNSEIMIMNGISLPNTIEALEIDNLQICALLAFGNCEIDLDEEFKPLLLPLSALTEEIEVNKKKFVPSDVLNTDFTALMNQKEDIMFGQYNKVLELLQWHFDIHGLIERGLAIDKRSVL